MTIQRLRFYALAVAPLGFAPLACTTDTDTSILATTTIGTEDGSTGPGTESSATTETTETTETTDETETESTGDEADTDTGPILDVAGGDTGGSSSDIPETCEAALAFPSSVGCIFYAYPFENDSADGQPFAVALSNVQLESTAHVQIETLQGGAWVSVFEFDLDSLSLDVRELARNGGIATSISQAYRINSDFPIIAYQFNPLDSNTLQGFSSDASLLLPQSSWENHYVATGWGLTGGANSYPSIAVVAAYDGTQVEVTPSVPTSAGPGVPAGTPGAPFTVMLDEGEVLQINSSDSSTELSGTRVDTSPNTPVAVFSGHECARIYGWQDCDHFEEQLPGTERWGSKFVAARWPITGAEGNDEPTHWELVADMANTVVTFTAPAGVTGLPAGAITLSAGEAYRLEVGGPLMAGAENYGDFLIEATHPLLVSQYGDDKTGSTAGPSMSLVPPTDQYLDRYVILAPEAQTWPTTYLIVSRQAGVEVRIDDVPIDDADFVTVAGGYEVARPIISAGVHVLDGESPFAVEVLGLGNSDSYAYMGGTSAEILNPVD